MRKKKEREYEFEEEAGLFISDILCKKCRWKLECDPEVNGNCATYNFIEIGQPVRD